MHYAKSWAKTQTQGFYFFIYAEFNAIKNADIARTDNNLQEKKDRFVHNFVFHSCGGVVL